MRLENAKPGQEVEVKSDRTHEKLKLVIKHVQSDGVVTFENHPADEVWYYLSDLRLANKPKRSELQKRIEELEGMLEYGNSTCDELRQHIDSILSGDYFPTRPHREKWQHVARVTGWTIKRANVPGSVLVNFDGLPHPLALPGEWTDEPFESRIAGSSTVAEKDTPK